VPDAPTQVLPQEVTTTQRPRKLSGKPPPQPASMLGSLGIRISPMDGGEAVIIHAQPDVQAHSSGVEGGALDGCSSRYGERAGEKERR